jgi:hypothetical protein
VIPEIFLSDRDIWPPREAVPALMKRGNTPDKQLSCGSVNISLFFSDPDPDIWLSRDAVPALAKRGNTGYKAVFETVKIFLSDLDPDI